MRTNFLLLILDGFGLSPDHEFNAIAQANTPTWDRLWGDYPHTLLDASGTAVGLPSGQIGNSEVGHMTIGAGRTVYQELTRIDQAIDNKALAKFFGVQEIERLGKNEPIHVMGLLSPGGVHSHENHFFALLKILAEADCPQIYVHAFLDGRDVPPRSAEASLKKLMDLAKQYPAIIPASIIGRYYAMDRDNRWDRTELAYDALTTGQTEYQAPDLLTALDMAYARGENDEFVKPTWIAGGAPIRENNVLCFINFRSDRARQLSRAFLAKDFHEFTRQASPKLSLYLSSLGKTQLRISETEKYAHVTFFFNGGKEEKFLGEERILIPSPKVATYDLKPEMSAFEVTDQLVKAIESERFDFLVCNLANADMVGHSGNFEATVKAIEVVDQCLKKIWDALIKHHGQMLITADHGNADCMFDEKIHQAHTAHTMALVPLVYVGHQVAVLAPQGVLADIAPTALNLMHLPIPKEMDGKVLFS